MIIREETDEHISSLQRNFDLCIPRKGTARGLSPNFHIHVPVGDLYIATIGPPIFLAAEYADRSWEYINRTEKHECRKWDCGRAVPFLRIYVSNFRYSFFAVFRKKADTIRHVISQTRCLTK
jgi:hypothetical protein